MSLVTLECDILLKFFSQIKATANPGSNNLILMACNSLTLAFLFDIIHIQREFLHYIFENSYKCKAKYGNVENKYKERPI